MLKFALEFAPWLKNVFLHVSYIFKQNQQNIERIKTRIAFFFFFNEIEVRWSYTKGVHHLKAWVGPPSWKEEEEEEEGILWTGWGRKYPWIFCKIFQTFYKKQVGTPCLASYY